MAIRVSPGTEKTHQCLGHKKSESKIGTHFAETIMASGKATSTGRTQDSTRPRHAETSKRTCKKGAIHTRHWANVRNGDLTDLKNSIRI